MYRRRRSGREKIAFGFDCFLDVITNVVGIILRLILVAWVGARAYTAAMQCRDPAPEADVAPLPSAATLEEPHPLEDEIAKARTELDEARRRLLAYLDEAETARARTEAAGSKVAGLRKEQLALTSLVKKEESERALWSDKVQLSALSLEALEKRSRHLLDEIKTLEKAPPIKKTLGYHTPVSRAVDGEELMFECQQGRLSYIDVPAYLHEVKNTINDSKIEEIAKLGKWTNTTSAVGAFRIRYTFESQKSIFSTPGTIRIALTHWVVEPISLGRGETLARALKEGSDFRRLVDGLDPDHTTVTFWVYPDSFALFRTLRDYLYESGIEVAGRPLPLGHPIGASIHGTKSRGQ